LYIGRVLIKVVYNAVVLVTGTASDRQPTAPRLHVTTLLLTSAAQRVTRSSTTSCCWCMRTHAAVRLLAESQHRDHELCSARADLQGGAATLRSATDVAARQLAFQWPLAGTLRRWDRETAVSWSRSRVSVPLAVTSRKLGHASTTRLPAAAAQRCRCVTPETTLFRVQAAGALTSADFGSPTLAACCWLSAGQDTASGCTCGSVINCG